MPLSDFASSGVLVQPEYYNQQLPGALAEVYVRKSVATRLKAAARMLPNRLSLIVLDGWRPTVLQSSLFQRHLQDLKSQDPTAHHDAVVEEATRYVSLPSENFSRPSPHLTGGAVDVSICDEGGDLLPMGTKFDAFDPRSATTYFEALSNQESAMTADVDISPMIEEPLLNRRLLHWIMTEQGFTAYSEEWWHFDYGNQFWALAKGQNAIYGAVLTPPAADGLGLEDVKEK